MEKMIFAWVIIAAASLLMLIKWTKSALGYLYCVGTGLFLASQFLYPFTSEPYEVMHCLTLGGGIGAVFGLIFALAIHANIGVPGVIACMILLPILMFVVGFIVILVLGFSLMIQQGSGNQVAAAGLVTWGLIAAIIGGGGSIIIIIFDN